MGYVGSDGQYHEGTPKIADMVTGGNINWKQTDHDRQRQDHKKDLLRPYLPNGEPNPEFITAYPEESEKVYKFIKSDEERAREQ